MGEEGGGREGRDVWHTRRQTFVASDVCMHTSTSDASWFSSFVSDEASLQEEEEKK